jgi:hypothetical protein
MKSTSKCTKDRYAQAHEEWFKERYPTAYKDGLYCKPKIPSTSKSNGLTLYICNFLNWIGHRATRINTQGRLIDGKEKQSSGVVLTTKKWIKSTTRRGTADISATINGRSVMIEIKIGSDKPSEYQLAEQAKERKAGGYYEFIKNVDDFYDLYDNLIKLA